MCPLEKSLYHRGHTHRTDCLTPRDFSPEQLPPATSLRTCDPATRTQRLAPPRLAPARTEWHCGRRIGKTLVRCQTMVFTQHQRSVTTTLGTKVSCTTKRPAPMQTGAWPPVSTRRLSQPNLSTWRRTGGSTLRQNTQLRKLPRRMLQIKQHS
jgi:hypothetical protein